MSETNWYHIQRKLEGRCEVCGGTLPNHYGVCPKWGEQILEEYRKIDESVTKIDEAIVKLLKSYNKNV